MLIELMCQPWSNSLDICIPSVSSGGLAENVAWSWGGNSEGNWTRGCDHQSLPETDYSILLIVSTV